MEATMNKAIKALSVMFAAAALTGCAMGASDVDYSQQRGINSDISASMDHGPTAGNAGLRESEEPKGALPWAQP
jgi:hypothetical protein